MISVCLATYNGEKYVKEQIESILSQLSANDEVIVSDDHSKDNTITIINSLQDKRIKIVMNNKQSGVAHSFENALLHAAGDFIFLADQDDIWAENKIKIVVEQLEKYDCALHNAQLIDYQGGKIDKDLFSIYNTRTGYFQNLIRNTFVGCCMAFRKELLKHVLPIPSQITMHDMWIALLAEKKGNTILIEDKLIYYRRHENNASTTSNKSKFSKYYQLKYRLVMLYHTILR